MYSSFLDPSLAAFFIVSLSQTWLKSYGFSFLYVGEEVSDIEPLNQLLSLLSVLSWAVNIF